MNPPILTAEEMRMVKEVITLPLMIYYIHLDIAKINEVNLKLNYLLVRALNQVQHDIFNEHLEIKKELKRRGIKVIDEQQNQSGVEADYLCRGSRHHMSLRWEFIIAETLLKVSHYTGVPLTDG